MLIKLYKSKSIYQKMVESKNKITWKGSQLFVGADDVKDPVLTPHQQSMIQCQICMMIL
jgi:hypothetical protein